MSMTRRVSAFICIVMSAVFLSSCSVVSADPETLIQAPSPTGELTDISEAFAKYADDYTLVFPTSGEHTSAYVVEDIDADGVSEAMVFYKLKSENYILHVNVLEQDGKRWRSVADYNTNGTDIDKVILSDLSGTGRKSIAVGIINSVDSSYHLEVLTFDGDGYIQCQMQNSYVDFACSDMDHDGREELVILCDEYSDNVVVKRVAVLCNFDESTSLIRDEIYSAEIDRGASDYSFAGVGSIEYGAAPTLTADGVQNTQASEVRTANALYFDAVKNEEYITEVIYFDEIAKSLTAPMYDTASGSNDLTVRSFGRRSMDINEDGEIEIPNDLLLPGSWYSNSVYATQWMQLQSDNSFIDVMTVYTDSENKFSMSFPDSWIDDNNVTVSHYQNTITFSLWDASANRRSTDLLEIRLVAQQSWDTNGSTASQYIRLGTKYGNVYLARILETDNKYSITEEQLVNGFRIK